MIKLPSGLDIYNLINDLRTLSWEAAEILLSYSKILKDSNYKSNILENDNINNPVTSADLEVNEIIIKRIKEKYKDINWEILSEENVKIFPENCDNNSDWIWVLDPLDGTKDFIQGTSNYAMHLALNYRHEPVIGIVLIPERDELWIANGEYLWCEKRNGTRLNAVMKCKKHLKDMTVLTSKNHNNKILHDLVQKINFRETISMGSIGCKITALLRGEGDIYITLSLPGKSAPKDWDFAAPEAILKAAGGTITNLENEELIYSKNSFEQSGVIIASNNKKNHKKICLQVKEIIKKYNIIPLIS